MTIAGQWINEDDCKARLTADVWRRICDDNADGTADQDPGQMLVSQSESYVASIIGANHDLVLLRTKGRTTVATEIRRLVLDVLWCRAARRYASWIRADWKAELAIARQELMDLRTALTKLDTTDGQETQCNAGGIVESGNPEAPDTIAPAFLNGLGDFT